jgi:hypothetical protein
MEALIMKTLIIPCAGKSSRFPGVKPKYLLTHPSGSLMIQKSIEGLFLEQFDKIIITIVKEHDLKFDASLILQQAFDIGNNKKYEIVILDQFTSCQAETIAMTINTANISGQIVVKDSDNFVLLETPSIPENAVAGVNIETFFKDINRLNAKSFLVVNDQNIIIDIIEKKIRSNNICIGIYSFASAEQFYESYRILKYSIGTLTEIYVSHIVSYLIGGKKAIFNYLPAKDYEDWGTLTDWNLIQKKCKTYFIDLDGVLFENTGKYGHKNWVNYCVLLEANLNVVVKLFNAGGQIVITTSRPAKYHDKIKKILAEHGIGIHAIITDCNHACRVLINDFAPTNHYPSCEAINIPRNGDLLSYIDE